jgi:hypothetical protein
MFGKSDNNSISVKIFNDRRKKCGAGGNRIIPAKEQIMKLRSTSPEGCWVKYQLGLRSIKLKTVARKANRSESMVSLVIVGVKNSDAVGKALALMLGYASYKDLMDAAYQQTKGGAV